MELGTKIEMARTAAGITRQELADLLFVSRELITKWENGTRRPDYQTIVRIEEALSLPSGDIITKEDCVYSELDSLIPMHEYASVDDLAQHISNFLRTINHRDSIIFINRYYLLKTNSEIASLCGIKENQVRSRLSKTIKKLNRFLKEER